MSSSSRSSVRSGWQIPTYKVTEFRPRRSNVALVIPVVNEGEKIRKQLREFGKTKSDVDLVVADGGSTDGSLEGSILSDVDSRALLVKTGPGRLSAQLRMAYSWCLDEGYEAVITMDGNGKDKVEHIERVLEALKNGLDYVQGSRYARGGNAYNTPLDRAFANRYIHAPLLNLASGLHLSDTTNGFRGYSSRFLLDERVAPFRDVFSNYELLFYLTVRAGQLGYKVTEVPVDRSYPEDTPAPTKINGIGARIAVLVQTLKAAMNQFAP